MKILNNIISGAATQFGREFGRAGANSILKGANSYTIENKSYQGSIKQSDSDIIKAIKILKNTSFSTQDKANISKLIKITNIAIPFVSKFTGMESLFIINNIKDMIDIYNSKYEHGEVMISNTDRKEFEYLTERRRELFSLLDTFNEDISEYISYKKIETINNRKLKKDLVKKNFKFMIIFLITSTISILIKFWANSDNNLSSLLSFSIFISIVGLITQIIRIVSSSIDTQEDVDKKYNQEYLFFSEF